MVILIAKYPKSNSKRAMIHKRMAKMMALSERNCQK
jgi:hypothetical protein